jgi:hypothetical protein
MPRDEVLAGDTRAWLEQASKDLRRAEILLPVTPPDVEGALFPCVGDMPFVVLRLTATVVYCPCDTILPLPGD